MRAFGNPAYSFSVLRNLVLQEEPCKLDQVEQEVKLEVTVEEDEVLTESSTTHNSGVGADSNKMSQDELHTGNKIYNCDVCGKNFSQSGCLKRHERVHTGVKPFNCDICGKSFSFLGSLRSHMRTHTGEKPFKCDVCGNTYAELNHLKTHKRVHTGEKPYKCNDCGKSYADSSNLTRHVRVHTGNTPYKCNVCEKVFADSSQFKRHSRVHTGERPFKCQVCRRSFAEAWYLTKHSRVHTGEKRYSCNECGKNYVDLFYLRKHELLHKCQKAYKCDICGKCYSSPTEIHDGSVRRKRAVFVYLVYKNYLKRTERRFWEHPLAAKRFLQGTFTTELRDDDTKFFSYFRMSIKSFDELASKISDVIKSEDTVMRLAIPPLEIYSASSYDERVMERRKFSPAPGFEPGFSALRADAFPLSHAGYNCVMDVIKMEPDVDPLAIQTSGNAEAEVKKPLPEDGNLLDLHVTGIKKERTDHWYELKSEMTYEETAEPRDFPVVKSEAEEGSCKLDPMEEVKLEVSAQDDEVLTEW
ncbi:hypothetical protein ANN_27531 [Periplaneta americana]|uniref:C2H2-type domain-containing protein n=1 Tax=Periplaneta americana TaxID=6978 RepID=A0ABQ8RW50_PERAM|nr:hypothetical protein ANN_27531 [Periplaneta americana]